MKKLLLDFKKLAYRRHASVSWGGEGGSRVNENGCRKYE
jgi:hypothetical protein